MRESEKTLRDFLFEKGFRAGWTTTVTSAPRNFTVTFFFGPDCKTLILQSFGEQGWELFRPVSESAKVLGVIEGLDAYLEEGAEVES